MQNEKNPDFLESESEAREGRALFHVIPVPLEQTVSYGGGTARGPGAILHASQQLERWDGFSEPLNAGIDTTTFFDCSGDITTILRRIEETVRSVVDANSIPVVLGGEHTVSLAPIRVLAQKNSQPIGIVQLDAHADLRESYEGISIQPCLRHAPSPGGVRLSALSVRGESPLSGRGRLPDQTWGGPSRWQGYLFYKPCWFYVAC